MEEGKCTVAELAGELKLSVADCLKVLSRLGVSVRSPEEPIDRVVREAAHKFIAEYRRRLRQKRAADKGARASQAAQPRKQAPTREAPPAEEATPRPQPRVSKPATPSGPPPEGVVVRPGLGPLRPPGSTPRPERRPPPPRPGARPPAPGGPGAPVRPGRPGAGRGRPGRVPRIPPAPAEVAAEKPVRRRASATQPARTAPIRPDRFEREERTLLYRRGRGAEARQVERKEQPVSIAGPLTVRELAETLGIKGSEAIRELMLRGLMVTLNHTLEADTARRVAREMGYEVVEAYDQEPVSPLLAEATEEEDPPEALRPRPPVVTVMGHVDHGKTSLLDAIRQTNVTAREAGGITQHIGASVVEHDGRQIVFIDTPGHEAFTAMRARGAKVTDIAVLVVAADDGVKPQTVEALNHARAAEVPVVVAINKMDLEAANPDRVRQQLSDLGLVPEEWGGQTVTVPVSAKTGEGLGTLLEMILLVADLEELRANPDRPARGTVVEAELDRGRGPVATVLVQNGTLRVGDAFVVGRTYGRVRAMQDFRGERLEEAPPSTPVQVLGLAEVPQAGDTLQVVDDERIARELALQRQLRIREKEMDLARRPALEDLFRHVREGQARDLKLLIKADTQGSAEALRTALERLEAKNIKVSVVHAGVGAISESDVMLAAASEAVVIGFNVRPDANARAVAAQEQVDLRTYRVIYDVINDVQAAIEGLLEPEYREVVQGRVQVRAIFRVPRVGPVAGCYVTEGKITRQSKVRLIRDGTIVHEGRIGSLKHFKDDVREVQQGFECGITLEGFSDYHEGDIIEAYVRERVS